MADNTRVPNVKREDFLSRLERARKAGGYTEDSVNTLVDSVVSNVNTLVAALNDAREKPASSAEADRLVEQARDLFEQQSRTAAEFVSAAQARAEQIEADAQTSADATRAEAESAAQELTDSTNTWASELRTSVQQEIEDQRAAAEADLEDVRARRERLAAEANDIIERLRSFYATQQENLQAMADGSATGGNPLVAAAEEEDAKGSKKR